MLSFDKGDFFTKIVLLKIFPSPDSSENPLDQSAIFSWQKRATAGSSFYDVEKKRFDQEIATDGWK
ncbi:hypothetical protein IWX83_000752 [Flavobacterium sp. CG_9.1]|nr:hypothetical protein [Flavobacterium sp. CG_9.1]